MREEVFELNVHLARDEETGRWYIAESDIPGLWLEAETSVALIQRIQDSASELIELNEAEIIAACKARQAKTIGVEISNAARPSPRIRPVFDSPLDLTFAAA